MRDVLSEQILLTRVTVNILVGLSHITLVLLRSGRAVTGR